MRFSTTRFAHLTEHLQSEEGSRHLSIPSYVLNFTVILVIKEALIKEKRKKKNLVLIRVRRSGSVSGQSHDDVSIPFDKIWQLLPGFHNACATDVSGCMQSEYLLNRTGLGDIHFTY
ncbi:hypothetical protein AB205_0119520, partial [Aquarana catesbeiana]